MCEKSCFSNWKVVVGVIILCSLTIGGFCAWFFNQGSNGENVVDNENIATNNLDSKQTSVSNNTQKIDPHPVIDTNCNLN